jgi:hypothetical protein
MTDEVSAVESEMPVAERMHRIMWRYYQRKWNPNSGTISTLRDWWDWPMLVRMPDIAQDFTVHIDGGPVYGVSEGITAEPKIMVFMLSETFVKINNDTSTAAIESIAGRIKIRGFEPERRRLTAALSFLTW